MKETKAGVWSQGRWTHENCSFSWQPLNLGQTISYIDNKFCTHFNRKSGEEIPAGRVKPFLNNSHNEIFLILLLDKVNSKIQES